MIREASLYRKPSRTAAPPAICAPTAAGSRPGAFGVCGVRENRDGTARHPRLRRGHRRPRRPDREEAVLPLPAGNALVLDRDRRLQLPLRLLPELADLAGFEAAGRAGRGGGRAAPEDIVRAARAARLPEHLLYVHRADDLLRVRPRHRRSGPGGRAGQHFRHQRLHDRRGARSGPPLARRGQRRPQGLPRRDLQEGLRRRASSPCSTRSAGCAKRGIWVEVTTLVVPGLNDGDAELGDIARFIAGVDRDIPWHISRFHPDYKYTSRPADASRRSTGRSAWGRPRASATSMSGTSTIRTTITYCPGCGKTSSDGAASRSRSTGRSKAAARTAGRPSRENSDMERYRFLAHPADGKFRAFGSTLEEAFANAALAVAGLMWDWTIVEPEVEIPVALEGRDLPQLLGKFLEEVLYPVRHAAVRSRRESSGLEIEETASGSQARGGLSGRSVDRSDRALRRRQGRHLQRHEDRAVATASSSRSWWTCERAHGARPDRRSDMGDPASRARCACPS